MRLFSVLLWLSWASICTCFVAKPLPRLTTPPHRSHSPDRLFSAVGAMETPVQASLPKNKMPAWKSRMTKAAMLAYITGICIALPAALLPQRLLHKLRLISRQRKETWAVLTAQFVARWMLRLVPFCDLRVVPSGERYSATNLPQPAVWVCNHASMLDVFFLLAADYRLRGRYKRPIKIVYWKQLEDNPVTRIFFRQAGFIPVDMAANGSGVANEYDKSTFKKLLQDCKQAFAEGFDIGILPEGQLNPVPEQGLQPVFTGAFTLARMSRRPIQIMALYGGHNLWHPNETIGMRVVDRRVAVRCYPYGRVYTSGDEFKATFSAVVGQFGSNGQDLPVSQLKKWLTGQQWDELQQQQKQVAAVKQQEQAAAAAAVEQQKQTAAVDSPSTDNSA